MSALTDIFTSTILIPTSDGLPGANPLTAYDVADKLETVNKLEAKSTKFFYNLYLKISDKESENIIELQDVTGFGMSRDNQTRPGSDHDYVVNLPGPVTYSDIRLQHLYTNDKFFLNWLKNGVTSGGASRADMELHFVLPTGRTIVFTLQDAFPTGWYIGPLNVKGTDALVETITITFSGLSYQSLNEN